MKSVELSTTPSIARSQIFDSVKEVISQEELVVLPGAAKKYKPDFFFQAFVDSGVVESATEQLDLFTKKRRVSAWFDVIYDPTNDNVYGHSKTRQPLHTDNAFIGDPPQISLFIMKKQAPIGGESTLISFSGLVKLLEQHDPTLLADLSESLVTFKKGDDAEPNVCKVIDLEEREINWNYYRLVRDSDAVQLMAERFAAFLVQVENENWLTVHKFKSGDVYLFNDLKFLHARKAFEASDYGDRVLSNCYWRIKS